MDQKPYPRYFVYGLAYLPPGVYIRVDGEHESQIMDPCGLSVRTNSGIDYWRHREQQGAMIETTRDAIAEQISRWNQFNTPKLTPPD